MSFKKFLSENVEMKGIIHKIDMERDYSIVKKFDPQRVSDAFTPENPDKDDLEDARQMIQPGREVHEIFAQLILATNILYTAEKKIKEVMPSFKKTGPNDCDEYSKSTIKTIEKITTMLKDGPLDDFEYVCSFFGLSTH